MRRGRRLNSSLQCPAEVGGCVVRSALADEDTAQDAPARADRALVAFRVRRIAAGGEDGQLRSGCEPGDREDEHDQRDVADGAELEQVPGRIPAEAVAERER